jgi:hypothetical protein
VAEELSVSEHVQVSQIPRLATRSIRPWTTTYLRQVATVDACCALVAGLLAYWVRFGGTSPGAEVYLWLGVSLPAMWLVALSLAGAHDTWFIGARRLTEEVLDRPVVALAFVLELQNFWKTREAVVHGGGAYRTGRSAPPRSRWVTQAARLARPLLANQSRRRTV